MKRMDSKAWTTRAVVLVATTLMLSTAGSGQEAFPRDDEASTAGAEVSQRYVGFPQIKEGNLSIPALAAPTIATDNIGNGRKPMGFDDKTTIPEYPLPESGGARAEIWNWSICSWAAANTFSNPRYFEDRMLERHGHQRWGNHHFGYTLQSACSGARFFATLPLLPYLATVRHPCECESTLGYYRSGSRAPGLFQRPPRDRRALIVGSAAIAGACVAFP